MTPLFLKTLRITRAALLCTALLSCSRPTPSHTPLPPLACSLLSHPLLPLLPSQLWVKPSAEMQFLYGQNVLKSGLGRITENTPAYTGVVIYSMSDIPLGFGVTAKSTNECRTMDPSGIVSFHQADVGGCCCL